MSAPDKNGIRIRPLSLWHIVAFAGLRNALDNESRHLIARSGERKERGLYILARMLISGRRTKVFLAWDSNIVIGHVTLVFPRFAKMKGNAYLTIALREAYVNKGLGSRLMDTAEEYAKKHGVRRMEIEVFGKNTNALRFYETRNYVVEGRKKDALNDVDGYDDIVLMAKFL